MDKELKMMMAGALSGAVTKTSTAPLERAKILLQVQGSAGKQYRGVGGTLRTIVAEEGFLGLFKGNGANVVRIVPNYALKFTFNDLFRDAVRREEQSVKDMTFAQLMLAGTIAGVFQMGITYPLETVRVRLTMSPALLGGFRYDGMLQCFRHTYQTQGMRGLYSGLSVALLSGAPYVGLQMTLYQWLQNRVNATIMSDAIPWYWKIWIGGVSGLIAQTVTYPGDTVRRCMQADGAGASHARRYTSTLNCILTIWRSGGAAGFMRGAWVNALKAAPGACIQFATYDYFKFLFFK
jgi:hypothetical protein